MANKEEISVGCKVDRTTAEKLKEKARERGIGVNSLLREMIKESFRPKVDERGMMNELCFMYDIDEDEIERGIKYLFKSGNIRVVNRKMQWNPRVVSEDYVSIDEKIDTMNVKEYEKKRLKQKIVDNLEAMLRIDDTGNGAGL